MTSRLGTQRPTSTVDDLLIYSSDSKDDHVRKTREVLRRLQAAGLYLDIKKCNFGVTEVKYLGFIVEAGREIRPDPEKIATIRTWERPTRVKGVRSFLGFANFYREFIPKFSDLAGPLLALTKKGVPLLGGCLSQYDARGILHPVAYHSARLMAPQKNYTIHDKELLSIISCLKAWSAELRSVSQPFTIFTDHKNLEYFTAPRIMSERQARWAETLALFNYQLHTKLVSLRGYGSYGWQSTTPARRPSGHKINRRPFQRSEDLETPAESEEDDHLETASAEDPPTTTEDPKRSTSENTATWPDPWPPFGTIDFSKTSSSWVLPNLRVEPPAIDLKTLQTMMLRDMAVMSQNPPPRTEVRNSPESSDGGSPRGSSLFSTDDLAELWETGVVADTTYEPRRLAGGCEFRLTNP
ncbi:uncharacterized protein CPUR_04265 [Claviceps purpurea 20.1]|uniref:Reverse transcriptase domain-containing protein n=1 Tax=Claviceps purpurea (strain 20.1) TaxID=1111077 RepID=M1VW02_CLAP2|nr:uncharacterized protein CPUR_04265 [Claviceps purpurea 20.1]